VPLQWVPGYESRRPGWQTGSLVFILTVDLVMSSGPRDMIWLLQIMTESDGRLQVTSQLQVNFGGRVTRPRPQAPGPGARPGPGDPWPSTGGVSLAIQFSKHWQPPVNRTVQTTGSVVCTVTSFDGRP
jgi:hypothetical protein